MVLYTGSVEQFNLDTIQNQISEKLKTNFFIHFRYHPSDGEVRSWNNSLKSLSQVFAFCGFNGNEQGVLLEYKLPLSSKRLDCMITGKDVENNDSAVIIELKQWDECSHTNSPNEVKTWVGGGYREILHPSMQVSLYRQYLQDTHDAFYDEKSLIQLKSCSYLHNYRFKENDPILDKKFNEILNDNPLFTADDVSKLSKYLIGNLNNGSGMDILEKIEKSNYRPSRKLMDHVGDVIKGNSNYVLLDEQKIVYDKVFTSIKEACHEKRKKLIIVHGGPGTGKSVIALNLMADLLLQNYNAHYATGSKAFTETLREVIGKRGAIQFKYFNSYMNTENDNVDVLICDESHRIRQTSNNRFTPKNKQSDLAQIEELINVSKVSVFFIDDRQMVRPDEIGSSKYIKDFAEKNNYDVWETSLQIQFRCNGSESFLNWVNNTLGIYKTPNILWEVEKEQFDFQIFNSPLDVENELRKKIDEGFTARMTAGFCWKWSKKLNENSELNNDVVIDDYCRPWNARPDMTGLPKDIPKSSLWAYDKNGIDQVGCIYTAQGFEFDYVGIIFGRDLIYNLDNQTWVADSSESYDTVVKRSKEKFIDLVKNTYRVLLSRGMKGCYVYFMDKDTERFFKSRLS